MNGFTEIFAILWVISWAIDILIFTFIDLYDNKKPKYESADLVMMLLIAPFALMILCFAGIEYLFKKENKQ